MSCKVLGGTGLYLSGRLAASKVVSVESDDVQGWVCSAHSGFFLFTTSLLAFSTGTHHIAPELRANDAAINVMGLVSPPTLPLLVTLTPYEIGQSMVSPVSH